ncbi:hypothetical protein GQ53DRAFT_796482 [Thozetella sp. PMI_491]|nr:hypothetical protein GQ53DRAFT_796482 [Thozetella sp. PMI_491]
MSDLCLIEEETEKQQAICRSLEFASQPSRFRSIAKAHHETFLWLFEAASSQKKLEYWLKSGSGIFWVSGRPGSGKSTLMKFLASHPRTLEALKTWADHSPIITADHYFWSPGTPMQKSQQGLLQTILLQIYQQNPTLIEQTCGPRWKSSARSEAWEVSELNEVLLQIAAHPTLQTKFCFFIDGLDEYEGDHMDLCEVLTKLVSSGNIKLCLASRPWNVFEGYFGHNEASKIYIHQLTRQDIRNYVGSQLSEHFRWKTISGKDYGRRASDLIETTTERAKGVFLWVFLVTKQLREGLTNFDSVSDLWRRLESFPTELEPFFKQMLDSVDKIYHQQASGALLITLGSEKPQPSMIYHFHELEYPDENYVAEITEIQQMTKCRLDARCRGLLQVVEKKVEFLHRTVADFLRIGEMPAYLSAKKKPYFNPELAKLRAYSASVVASTQVNIFQYSASSLFTVKIQIKHTTTYADIRKPRGQLFSSSP